MADGDGICKRAAALIVKYDISKGSALTRVKCFEVVPDPTNREGLFAVFSDVVQCGEDVCGIGYDLRYAKAVVTQLPVNEAERQAIIDFNAAKHKADPRIPPVDVVRLLYSGSGGNTMFVFMRCVLHKSEVADSFLCADGKLSLAKLRDLSPEFADAIEDGVPATILSRAIRVEEPDGLHVIQAAENSTGGVQRLESEVQICKRAGNLLVQPSVLQSVGVVGVALMMKKQVPHMESDVEGLIKWALVQGGSGAAHVDWLGKHHSRTIPGRRRLDGDVWGALATSVPARLVKCRRMITYMLYSCPSNMVKKNRCSWMSPSEIASLCRKDSFLKMADEVESKLDILLGTFLQGGINSDLPSDVQDDVDCRCENRLARLLCKKDVEGVQKFDSVEAVINAALSEIQAPRIYAYT